jgi:hypothetical protein
VLSTLKSLIDTGDTIISIEGILSGTLSYIFNTWQPGQPFSEVVAAAQQQGYTEPDPREDLSGDLAAGNGSREWHCTAAESSSYGSMATATAAAAKVDMQPHVLNVGLLDFAV